MEWLLQSVGRSCADNTYTVKPVHNDASCHHHFIVIQATLLLAGHVENGYDVAQWSLPSV